MFWPQHSPLYPTWGCLKTHSQWYTGLRTLWLAWNLGERLSGPEMQGGGGGRSELGDDLGENAPSLDSFKFLLKRPVGQLLCWSFFALWGLTGTGLPCQVSPPVGTSEVEKWHIGPQNSRGCVALCVTVMQL